MRLGMFAPVSVQYQVENQRVIFLFPEHCIQTVEKFILQIFAGGAYHAQQNQLSWSVHLDGMIHQDVLNGMVIKGLITSGDAMSLLYSIRIAREQAPVDDLAASFAQCL